MTLGLIGPRPAILVPRPLEELVDVSELDESGASDEDRRPVWTTRVEPCACGGGIFAPDMDGMIQAALLVHYSTTLHQLWRRRTGIR